jgi:hypothetical protein
MDDNKKQRAVIDDLFAVKAEEKQILDKHKVDRLVDDSSVVSMLKLLPVRI